MNLSDALAFATDRWQQDITPRLVDYVREPALSPAFDPSWAAHGRLASVVADAHAWCAAQPIDGLRLEIVAIEGRTPCQWFEAPATGGLGDARTVMFYGHLDKQPEMTGWRDGLGPWRPVIENGRLYGRGSADDGYAAYAAMTVLRALDAQGTPRPRCVGLIETCEESGSPDLPHYLAHLAPRIGDVGLVVGLDSGCGDYERLWVTTSLRGLVGGVLTVEVLDEGVHSGNASGLVPSSFRIARHLLSRIEDARTGEILLPELQAAVPDERLAQVQAAGGILGDLVWQQFPWAGCTHDPAGHAPSAAAHAQPTTTDPVEAILARTWRPALSVTGAAGFPAIDAAGNVLRPRTSLKLSMRLPPTVDGERAARALKTALERDAPYQARVRFDGDWGASGWNAPPTAP